MISLKEWVVHGKLIWFHPSRPPLESCHSLVEPHLVVEPLPGKNQNPWQGQSSHIPPTENQRMSTRNDKLKRKHSTLSELEPTKFSLQGKYPLYSSQGGVSISSSKSSKIFTFWMTWKNPDPKGLRIIEIPWEKAQHPGCEFLHGSWGHPQTWSWAKSTPLVDPPKKSPPMGLEYFLPTWMDEIYGTCR